MSIATTALKYGWAYLASLTVGTGTIFEASNTLDRITTKDRIEETLMIVERCTATKYGPTNYAVDPPAIVRTWTDTNGASVIMTNALEWRDDLSMKVELDAKLQDSCLHYVDTYAVSNTTPPFVSHTFTGLLTSLDLGNHTNFTAVPAIGTNAATYGPWAWRDYVTPWQERYKFCESLDVTHITNAVHGREDRYYGYGTGATMADAKTAALAAYGWQTGGVNIGLSFVQEAKNAFVHTEGSNSTYVYATNLIVTSSGNVVTVDSQAYLDPDGDDIAQDWAAVPYYPIGADSIDDGTRQPSVPDTNDFIISVAAPSQTLQSQFTMENVFDVASATNVTVWIYASVPVAGTLEIYPSLGGGGLILGAISGWVSTNLVGSWSQSDINNFTLLFTHNSGGGTETSIIYAAYADIDYSSTSTTNSTNRPDGSYAQEADYDGYPSWAEGDWRISVNTNDLSYYYCTLNRSNFSIGWSAEPRIAIPTGAYDKTYGDVTGSLDVVEFVFISATNWIGYTNEYYNSTLQKSSVEYQFHIMTNAPHKAVYWVYPQRGSDGDSNYFDDQGLGLTESVWCVARSNSSYSNLSPDTIILSASNTLSTPPVAAPDATDGSGVTEILTRGIRAADPIGSAAWQFLYGTNKFW